ncbi:hypothetical protein K443DRAFT_673661 [Laccaria amethystina LaAM-08-1]|uniref:Uncharacterized protein n=1 Tax=Laccaria amethystina LaAM-08-1 TaxID=1095629 RepID=A0A0C9YGE7_9AGAR|nr:hypothetical protein K443DRAFT_673661 [Laccaria amethystina LaAM-08-1]
MARSKRKADTEVEGNAVEGSEISAPPPKRARRIIKKSVESDPPEPRAQRPRRAAAKKNTGEATTHPDEPPAKKTRVRRSKASQPQPNTEAGASSAAGPSSSQIPPSKKKKAPASSAPESRGAPFFTSCPQNIQDRVGRVMSQRFFMIERRRNGGELQEEFSVLGSTSNVYTVTIGRKPKCNCPDTIRGNHCKHIMFVLLKVLQVPQTSNLWYQKGLLTSELETIFARAPLAPNDVTNPRVREAYDRALGRPSTSTAPAAAPESSAGKKRIPGPEDDCPVCYDGMEGVAEASLVFCDECGNALHQECFAQWRQTSQNQGKALTCVWCRSPWATVAAGHSKTTSSSPSKRKGPYLNLGIM